MLSLTLFIWTLYLCLRTSQCMLITFEPIMSNRRASEVEGKIFLKDGEVKFQNRVKHE